MEMRIKLLLTMMFYRIEWKSTSIAADGLTRHGFVLKGRRNRLALLFIIGFPIIAIIGIWKIYVHLFTSKEMYDIKIEYTNFYFKLPAGEKPSKFAAYMKFINIKR